jgi:hypothetical protein
VCNEEVLQSIMNLKLFIIVTIIIRNSESGRRRISKAFERLQARAAGRARASGRSSQSRWASA